MRGPRGEVAGRRRQPAAGGERAGGERPGAARVRAARAPGWRAALPVAALAALIAPSPSRAGDHAVTVGPGFTFNPSTLNIQAGDSVTWSYGGGVPHNAFASGIFRCANGCDDQGGNGTPSGSAWTFTRTFDTPGTINYFCQVHGLGMSGTINVGGGGGQPGSLRFAVGTATVGEATASVNLTVTRTGGDEGAVSVDFTTANGSATAGQDYTAASGTLTWPDNDDDPRVITVSLTNDTADEPNETFSVTLMNPGGGATLGSPSAATVTITDNDPAPGGPGSLAFDGPTFDVAEDGGPAVITVERTGGTTGAVGVSYAATAGSAAAGSDFQTANGTLSWANGDGAAKTFNVPIVDDSIVEGEETVNLTLSNPTGGATLGSPATATLTIGDDDTGPVGPCSLGPTTLCFIGERFQLTLDWRFANDQTGQGQAVPLTDRSGAFYFLNPENLEMLVKMVNACAVNDRYWVFFAATTNVEFTLLVTDTQASQSKSYFNPLNRPAPPVLDTSAFATCP